jgi:CheY-like chemotaxis protein
MNKVLLIEDETVLQDMYRDKFTHEGFEIETAGDGQEGLDKMKAFQPDVVLLDLILPHMDGFSVLEKVKTDPTINKIPILVLTNIFADAEDLVKNEGVTYFLLKSNTTPDEVVEKVKKMVMFK